MKPTSWSITAISQAEAVLQKMLLLLLCVNPIAAFSQMNVNVDEKTVAQLNQFRADYIHGILNDTPEAMVGHLAEDVRLMPEFQLTVVGKSNASSYFSAFAARFQTQDYDRKPKEVLDLGPRVVEIGLFATKMTHKVTHQKYTLNGKYLDIWERTENGMLILITEAWNYSQPIDFADQLKFTEVPSVNIALQPHLVINSPIRFELAALNELLVATVTQHDARLWSQFYADDGMFIYSNNPIYEGRKALDQFLEKHVAQLPIFEKLDVRNDRIDDLGHYVIVYESHIANWRNGDSSGIGTGKGVTIWRREKAGSLKIFRAMAMYD